jgi:putative inorganic carbon (HCO3(-)) transporter
VPAYKSVALPGQIDAAPAGAVGDEVISDRTVSDDRTFAAAGRLRALSYALEAALYGVVGGSALAIGAVHPWAYVPLWLGAGAIAILLGLRAAQIRGLRRRLGLRPFAFQVSGRWLVLDPAHDEPQGWGFDLSRPVLPHPALLWPGVAFLAWGVVQMAPLPAAVVDLLSPGRGHVSADELRHAHAFTIDAAASLRGLAFALSMLVFYIAAGTLAEHPAARGRFRAFVAWFGALLAVIALVQIAIAAKRIYGIFMPEDTATFFGTFVNRNHFAAYMTLCAMASLAILDRAFDRYRYHLGGRPSFRRTMVVLGRPAGVRLILAVVPVLLTIGTLIATTSRAGIISFVFAILLAAILVRQHREHLPAGALAFLLVLPLAWFGLERLHTRFGDLLGNKIGRTAIWRESVASMSGTWLTGAGLNTYRSAVSRALPLVMPAGATAWPEEVAEALPARLSIGYRTPVDLPGWTWYEEAHNDYIQLAVEMGAIGAAIGLWGLILLRRRLREPWLAAGVAGILAHSTVDFSLQIPAVAVLFFVVCAYAETTSLRSSATPRQ